MSLRAGASDVALTRKQAACALCGGRTNVILGVAAGRGNPDVVSSNIGSRNVILGANAGKCIKNASDNVLLGAYMATNLCSGSYNVILGRGAANCIFDSSDSVYLGKNARRCGCTGNANVAIGKCALLGGSTVSGNTGS